MKLTINDLKEIVKAVIKEQESEPQVYKANHVRMNLGRRTIDERSNTMFKIGNGEISIKDQYETYTYDIDSVNGNIYMFKKHKMEVTPDKIILTYPNGKVSVFSVMKVR